MVFTVSVRNLSFKQDLSNIMLMISDQKSTYAILKYAYDVPVELYDWVLEELDQYKEAIIHKKLLKLILNHKPLYDIDLSKFEHSDSEQLVLDFSEVNLNGITNTLQLT